METNHKAGRREELRERFGSCLTTLSQKSFMFFKTKIKENTFENQKVFYVIIIIIII